MNITKIADDLALLTGNPPPALFDRETPFTSGLSLIVALEVEECASIALTRLPRHLLTGIRPLPLENLTILSNGERRLPLPSDFLHLHSFRMSDWKMTLHTPLPHTHPLLPLQEGGMRCVAAAPDRPLIFLDSASGDGTILRIFGSDADATPLSATYVPRPKIDAAGEIDIPPAAYRETLRLLAARIGQQPDCG